MEDKNFFKSKSKWEKINGVLSMAGKVDWTNIFELLSIPCGHCVEHEQACEVCLLYNTIIRKRRLCSTYHADNDLFQELEQIACGEIPRNKSRALRIAQKILQAIMKDKPTS